MEPPRCSNAIWGGNILSFPSGNSLIRLGLVLHAGATDPELTPGAKRNEAVVAFNAVMVMERPNFQSR